MITKIVKVIRHQILTRAARISVAFDAHFRSGKPADAKTVFTFVNKTMTSSVLDTLEH